MSIEMIHGNALEILPKIKRKYDVCITDPPYSAAFIGKLYEKLKKYQESVSLNKKRNINNWNWGGIPGAWTSNFYKTNEEFEFFTKTWMSQVFNLLPSGGFFACFGSNLLSHVNINIGISSGFELRDVLLWKYSSSYSKGYSLKRITNNQEDSYFKTLTAPSYETIFLFQKPTDGNIINNWEKHRTGFLNTKIIPNNIIEIPKVSKKEKENNPHYSIKPLKLMEILTTGLCAKSVLDPFMGSSPLSIVCLNHKIDYLGIELEKEFYDFATNRIKNA